MADHRLDDVLIKLDFEIPDQSPYVELNIETHGCKLQLQESVTGGAAGFQISSGFQIGPGGFQFEFGGIFGAEFDFVVKYGIPTLEDCPRECGLCCPRSEMNKPHPTEILTKRQKVTVAVESHHKLFVEKIFGTGKKFQLWDRHILAKGTFYTACDCNCSDDLSWYLKPLRPKKECQEHYIGVTHPKPLPIDGGKKKKPEPPRGE